MNLNEAFKALESLNEEVFDVSDDGLQKLSDFMEDDIVDDDIKVIDPEATTEDELSDSYVGKVILDCGVCHSKIYKDKEEVTLDDEGTLANVGEECPYCYTSDGFKVVGEIAPFSDDDKSEDEAEDVVEVEASDEDKVEENLEEGIFGIKTKKEKDAEAKARADKEAKEKADKEAEEERELARQQASADSWARHDANKRQAQQDYNRNRYNSIKGDKPSNTGHRGVNYSGGDYYSEDLEEGLFGKKKELYTISVKEKDGKWTPIHSFDNKEDAIKFKAEYEEKNPDQKYLLHTGNKFESLEESIEDLSMTANDAHKVRCNDCMKEFFEDEITYNEAEDKEYCPYCGKSGCLMDLEIGEDENGKVTVTMEPATADGGEMIAPTSAETEEEIVSASDDGEVEGDEETIDIEIDEVDEESIDELGESYLTEVYHNVKSFKTSSVSTCGNKFIVEGRITFKSGKTGNTSFILESHSADKMGRVSFVGGNKHFSNSNRAYTLNGKVSNNKFIAESLRYNYRTQDKVGVRGKVTKRVK